MPNLDQPLGPANLTALLFLGVALLWTVKLTAGRRQAGRDGLRRVLQMAGILLTLIGGVGLLVSIAGAPSIWLLIFGAIVLLMAVNRFRAAERRALLSMLAASAEKGIPLSVGVRTFADRRDDELGDRFLRLAGLLEGGMSLPWALARSGNRVPLDLAAAVDLGEQVGALGPTLRKTISRSDDLDFLLKRSMERFFYLTVLLAVSSFLMSFFAIKIMPTIAELLAEFAIEPPPVTAFAIGVSEHAVRWSLIPIGLSALMWLVMIGFGLHYMGQFPTDVVLLDRLSFAGDRANLLRALSLAVRGRRPIAETIRVLSWRYPKRLMRKRLEKASRQIDAGGDWRESLRKARVITAAEAAVFSAAEQVGNLGWALEEMADGGLRRLVLRLQATLAVVFPAAIIAFGATVAVVALSVMTPLIELIERLS